MLRENERGIDHSADFGKDFHDHVIAAGISMRCVQCLEYQRGSCGMPDVPLRNGKAINDCQTIRESSWISDDPREREGAENASSFSSA